LNRDTFVLFERGTGNGDESVDRERLWGFRKSDKEVMN
jgi:hypothetical protein